MEKGSVPLIYPTDTFYALGVDPGDEEAVRQLFVLKGREAEAAIPLIAASVSVVRERCGVLPPLAARLADRFWPGPLSLILDAPAWIAPAIHGGKGTIAVRVPALVLARDLAQAHGGFLTATSANRSGDPPAATVAALGAFGRDPRVRVIDGGPTAGGAPSTIVDARGTQPILVRTGAIAWDRVLESLEK